MSPFYWFFFDRSLMPISYVLFLILSVPVFFVLSCMSICSCSFCPVPDMYFFQIFCILFLMPFCYFVLLFRFFMSFSFLVLCPFFFFFMVFCGLFFRSFCSGILCPVLYISPSVPPYVSCSSVLPSFMLTKSAFSSIFLSFILQTFLSFHPLSFAFSFRPFLCFLLPAASFVCPSLPSECPQWKYYRYSYRHVAKCLYPKACSFVLQSCFFLSELWHKCFKLSNFSGAEQSQTWATAAATTAATAAAAAWAKGMLLGLISSFFRSLMGTF